MDEEGATVLRSYVWGVDLAGALPGDEEGAGEIGGLLMGIEHLPASVCHFAAYDANNAQVTKTTYGYDTHGRQNTTTDARNGTTTYTFNSSDLVETVTTPPPGTGQAAQVTTTYYNNRGWAWWIVYADGTSLTNEFNAKGERLRTYGSRTYPVGYGYDAQGRLTTMTNWTTFNPSGAGAGQRVTQWFYNGERGWLDKKVHAGESDGTVDYQYKDSGRLWKRHWERGVTTTYAYNNAGDLWTIDYSDTTPDVTHTYDRRGRLKQVDQGGNRTVLGFNDAGQPLSEAHTLGVLSGLTVSQGYDDYLRRTSLTLNTSPAVVTGFDYDAASRLHTVTSGSRVATYSYLANSPLIQQITFKHSGDLRMTTTRQHDFLNRLSTIGSVPPAAGQLPLSYGYGYNDANQRTRVTLAEGSFWVYGYDALGQVTSGKKYWSDGTPVPGQQFEYGFDDIGNRTVARWGGDGSGGGLRSASYTVNERNQYTERDAPGGFDVVGLANAGKTVTVNSSPADYRRGEYFQEAISVSNGSVPVWQGVTVTTSGGGSHPPGSVWVPEHPEQFNGGPSGAPTDDDGNLAADGRWTYSWDAENRLVRLVARTAVGPQQRIDFGYDWRGRRISKTVWNNSGGTGMPVLNQLFVYEGWNLVAELNATNQVVIRSYAWGLDLSGSAQGAGGVGGLLFAVPASGNGWAAAHDGNGNVMGLCDMGTGAVTARYEYGPFGEVIRASGTGAREHPFRFSTKYQDEETDFLYYGHRFYNPTTGRWLNRDPINEPGFNLLIRSQSPFNLDEEKNLYGFARNNPVMYYDADGRFVPVVAIFFYGNAIGNIGIACYSCKKLNDCLETARDYTKRAGEGMDPEKFQEWLRAAKPGSECTGLAKDCGVRVISATFWVAGRLLILKYLAK